MATTSAIGMVTKNGSVRAVACHWDGYIAHVGRILHDCYSDEHKVRRLLALGSLCSLEEALSPPRGVRHSLEHPMEGVTVAYHRDGGEDMMPPLWFENADTYRMDAESVFMANYVYLFKDGVWLVLDGQAWVDVSALLQNFWTRAKNYRK